MTPTNHKNVGRTVHNQNWVEPKTGICPTCNKEFTQVRLKPLLCCDDCIATKYEAWYQSYCPVITPVTQKAQRKVKTAHDDTRPVAATLNDLMAQREALQALLSMEG